MFSTSLLLAERGLADAALDDAGLLDAELDRAALGGLDGARRRPSSPCRPRVRHQAARAQHLAEPPDQRHHVRAWRCSGRSRSCRPGRSSPGPRRRRCRRQLPWLRPPWRRARTPRRAAVRPVPFGRLTTPRTIWSACLGSTPRFMAISTVSSNFAGGALLDQLHGVVDRIELDAVDAVARLADALSNLCHVLAHHLEAHRPGGALDHRHRGLDRRAVQIGHLLLGDLADLRLA